MPKIVVGNFLLRLACFVFAFFIKPESGQSTEINTQLRERILTNLSKCVELKYYDKPSVAILSPQQANFLLIDEKSTIHDLYEIDLPPKMTFPRKIGQS